MLGVLGALVVAGASLSAQAPEVEPALATIRWQFGGELRQQFERFANEEWGSAPPDDNGYWLQRYMMHAGAALGERVRTFVELKSGIESGRVGGPRPPDED